MVKLKVSYEKPSEFANLYKLLGADNIDSVKLPKKQEGKYRKAYITIKDCKKVEYVIK